MSSDYGMKISTELINVSQANPQQTLYSSKYSNFKIMRVLTVTLTATAGSPNPDNTVANPLSYGPFFLAYVSKGDSTTVYRLANQSDLSINWSQDTDLTGCTAEYRPGTNDFKVSVATTVASDTVYTFKIVVFVDKVSGTSASVASGGDLGIRVSKENKPVKTADDTDMSMTTEFKNLTVFDAGTADVSWDGSAYTPNVTHNLGYVPIFLCFFNPTGDATWGGRYMNVPVTNSFNSVVQSVEAWADTTTLTFQTATTAPAERFRYLIFNERLV